MLRSQGSVFMQGREEESRCSMYCPECDADPCRYLPDTARTVEGYDSFMRELVERRERTREEVEAIFIYALLLGLEHRTHT
jgi:hypothetical protein